MIATIGIDCSSFLKEFSGLLESEPTTLQKLSSSVLENILNLPDIFLFTERSRTLGANGVYEIIIEVKLRRNLNNLISTFVTG
jgi:hypothetical protein